MREANPTTRRTGSARSGAWISGIRRAAELARRAAGLARRAARGLTLRPTRQSAATSPAWDAPGPPPDPDRSAAVDTTSLVLFIDAMKAIADPKVIELGTRRQPEQERTRHAVWVPHAAEYIGVDYEPGEDVDLVADVHELSRYVPREHFDAVITCSTLEHVKYPWMAAVEIAKVMKVGALVFVHTHQTFAVHAHPHDYWRFTTEGLRALFSPALGLETLSAHYQYPCRIVAPDDPFQAANPSYLNVCLLARKVAATPEAFVPDLSR